MKKVIWNGLLFLVSFYLGMLILVYVFQRSFLYLPDQSSLDAAEQATAGFEAITFGDAGEDQFTSSLWRSPRTSEDPVFLHFHGNAGSTAGRVPIYQMLARDGAGVLAAGYPGYGGSNGSPTEQGFYRAAQASYDWLIRSGYPADRIVIVGQSLGSGVATWLASRNPAACLILEAAYTGIDDMAQKQFPFLPAKILAKDKYRSIDRVGEIDMPLIWIHGTDDELIPFTMGQQLFDAAPEPKTAHPIKGGGHNDLWERGIDRIIRAEAKRCVSATELPVAKVR